MDPGAQRIVPASGRPPLDVLVVFFESLVQSYAHPDQLEAYAIPRLSALRQRAQTFGALQGHDGQSKT